MKTIVFFLMFATAFVFSITCHAVEMTGTWLMSLDGEIWLPISGEDQKLPHSEDYNLDCTLENTGKNLERMFSQYKCVIFREFNYAYPPPQTPYKFPILAKIDLYRVACKGGCEYGVIYATIDAGYILIFPFDFDTETNEGKGIYQLLTHPYTFSGRGEGKLYR